MEPDFKGTGHEERVYEVTRSELFQVFVAVFARLEAPARIRKRNSRLKKLRRKERRLAVVPKIDEPKIEYRTRPQPKDEFVNTMIARLMTERPERGGPIMTVR